MQKAQQVAGPQPRLHVIAGRPVAEQRPHDAAWMMDVGAFVLGALALVATVGVVTVCILSLVKP